MFWSHEFFEFEKKIRGLYDKGKYGQIIDLIDREMPNFSDNEVYLRYWQIGMASRLGNYDLAFHLMDELIRRDLWISQYLLHTSPSLEPMFDIPAYKTRVEKFASLQEVAHSRMLPLLTFHKEGKCLSTENPCPLLIGLHANQSSALASIPYWKPAALEGWLVAIPQSTQALWSGAYVWDQREIAQREVEDHRRSLLEKYDIKSNQILLGGHDAGGELSIWLPLSGGIEVRGFIAINPTGIFIEEPERVAHLLQINPPKSKMRAGIIIGENDPAVQHNKITEIIQILNQFDIACYQEEVVEAEHSYHPGYGSALLRAVDFVMS